MRTSCCHTKKYKSENEAIMCLNQDCSNYLAETKLLSKMAVKIFTASLLFCFIMCFCQSDYSSVQRENTLLGHSGLAKLKRMVPCTDTTLKQEINEKKIICPEEVYAQIMIESGHMTSFLSKRANNLLGMRYPYKRMTTAIGIYLVDEDVIVKGSAKDLMKYAKKNQYAVYDTWQDCVADYKLWQDQYFHLAERYLNFLGNYYAEDANYAAKIKRMTK